MRRRLGHLFALVPTVLALSAPAGADAAGWATSPPVSPSGRVALAPMVGLTPSGQRIVAWEQFQPNNGPEEGIAVRVGSPGGDFGPVQLLTDTRASSASLTIGSDGTAALVWFDQLGEGRDAAHIARLSPGDSSFVESSPVPLGASILEAPTVAVAGGDIFVALGTRDDVTTAPNTTSVITTIQVLQLAVGASAVARVGGSAGANVDQQSFVFGAAKQSFVFQPSIAVAGATVHVVWEDDESGAGGPNSSFSVVRHATRPIAGGNFTTQTPISTVTAQSPSAPELRPLLGAGNGRAYAVWVNADHGPISYQDVNGGQPHAITINAHPDRIEAVIDAADELVLAWDQGVATDSSFGAFSTVVAADGSPGPVVRLTAPSANRVLEGLAVGPDGSSLALTDRLNDDGSPGADEQVQASIRPSGGAFGAPEDISGVQDHSGADAGDTSAVAIGPGGRTVVAWSAADSFDARNDSVFLSERDTVPPAIGAVSVPANATTATALAMFAAVSDALSPVTVSWDYGDGSGATGASVTHAFGAPGTYTITVTARDAAGNVSAQTRQITVRVASATPDTTPPVIAGLTLSHIRFRASNSATAEIAARRRAATGTTFRLHLSERSTLLVAFAGKLAGHRLGKRCLAGPGRGRGCSVIVSPGAMIRSGRGPGAVSIPFSGRLGASYLSPGSYTAAITAVDAAGNGSAVKIVKFTVVAK